MRTKIFVLSMIAVIVVQGISSAVIVFDEPEGKPDMSKNFVVNDPRLNPYNNPTEIDLQDGQLHISFKGIFRSEKYKDQITFVFVAVSTKDMELRTDRSEAFDVHGNRFGNWSSDWIGRERTRKREIIDGIPMLVEFWLQVPEAESSKLPTIARVNFCFNGQWFQFRNVKTYEWSSLEGLCHELGLELRPEFRK